MAKSTTGMSGGRSGGTAGSITTKIPVATQIRSQTGAKTMPMGPPITSVDEVLGISSKRMPPNPPWSCDPKQEGKKY